MYVKMDQIRGIHTCKKKHTNTSNYSDTSSSLPAYTDTQKL